MSLVPYKVTALKRSDIDGMNVMAGAVVSIFNQNSEYATLYTDDTGETEVGNPFGTDYYGEREVWINPGIYKVSITGGQEYDVSIGGAFFVNVIDDDTASYALNASHIGSLRIMTNADPKTISVAPGVGSRGYSWAFTNAGAGAASFSAGEGVNIIPNAGGTPAIPQDGTVSIICTGANEYRLIGQTVAA